MGFAHALERDAAAVNRESQRLPVLAALAVTILSGASAFTTQEEALRAYSPGSLARLRFIVASVLMAGGLMVSRGTSPPLQMPVWFSPADSLVWLPTTC